MSSVAKANSVEEKTVSDGFIRRLRPEISSTAEFDAAVEQWLRGKPEKLQDALLRNIKEARDAKRVFDVPEKV